MQSNIPQYVDNTVIQLNFTPKKINYRLKGLACYIRGNFWFSPTKPDHAKMYEDLNNLIHCTHHETGVICNCVDQMQIDFANFLGGGFINRAISQAESEGYDLVLRGKVAYARDVVKKLMANDWFSNAGYLVTAIPYMNEYVHAGKYVGTTYDMVIDYQNYFSSSSMAVNLLAMDLYLDDFLPSETGVSISQRAVPVGPNLVDANVYRIDPRPILCTIAQFAGFYVKQYWLSPVPVQPTPVPAQPTPVPAQPTP